MTGGLMLHLKGGRLVDLDDLKPSDIDIDQIAHALAMQCRWNGNTRYFYSVAQHSIQVSLMMEDSTDRLYGLLHDAAEAFIGDIATPIKRRLMMRLGGKRAHYNYDHNEELARWEGLLLEKIYQRYGLAPHTPASVKDADTVARNWEYANLITCEEDEATPDRCMGPEPAKQIFLKHFNALTTQTQRKGSK